MIIILLHHFVYLRFTYIYHHHLFPESNLAYATFNGFHIALICLKCIECTFFNKVHEFSLYSKRRINWIYIFRIKDDSSPSSNSGAQERSKNVLHISLLEMKMLISHFLLRRWRWRYFSNIYLHRRWRNYRRIRKYVRRKGIKVFYWIFILELNYILCIL